MSRSFMTSFFFFFSSRRRHTRFDCDWSSDVCSSDLQDDQEIFEARHFQRFFFLDRLDVFAEAAFGDGPMRDGEAEIFVGRSEERRVGKECRSGWLRYHEKKKKVRSEDTRRTNQYSTA